eukprot:15345785-Ditylum_brightwellii.AAC.1
MQQQDIASRPSKNVYQGFNLSSTCAGCCHCASRSKEPAEAHQSSRLLLKISPPLGNNKRPPTNKPTTSTTTSIIIWKIYTQTIIRMAFSGSSSINYDSAALLPHTQTPDPPSKIPDSSP